MSTVCSRQDRLGGWAMGALSEAELWSELVVESCTGLRLDGAQTLGITLDGGRYKQQVLDSLAPAMVNALQRQVSGARIALQYGISQMIAGIQVADIISNTLYHALGDAPTAAHAAALIAQLKESGRLTIRNVELPARRPEWRNELTL